MSIDVTVELLLNATWVDITAYVRVDPGIDITLGVQNEAGVADANTCTLTVNNRDGRFTPRNTAGAYYPHLKRNTPLRVTVGTVVRYAGEVSEFPSRWNPNSSDVWVTLQASGILRRLLRATSLESTLTTAVLGLSGINAYWPCEDGKQAVSLTSATSGVDAGVITGNPKLAGVDPGVMSKDIPVWFGGPSGFHRGDFTPATAVSVPWTVGALCVFPDDPADALIAGQFGVYSTDPAATITQWTAVHESDGSLGLLVTGPSGTISHATGLVANISGKTLFIKLEVQNTGANVSWEITAVGLGSSSGTILANQASPVTRAALFGNFGVGHLIIADGLTALDATDFTNGLTAYAGETVTSRLTRLQSKYGITITQYAGAAESVEHGAQPDGTLLDVLRATEKADGGGILRDSIDAVDLSFITRRGRYNDQRSLLTLNYSAKQVIPPLEPTDDDQNIRNEIKANRSDGSSARCTVTTGALSNADYPSGVGPYPFEDTYAIYSDDQLPYLASWVARLGTVDETRFPAVTVDLVANASLVTDAESIRPGHRLRITNLPAFAGATSVDLQVLGWREHLSSHERRITFICAPGSPWNVFELNDSTYGRLGTGVLAY